MVVQGRQHRAMQTFVLVVKQHQGGNPCQATPQTVTIQDGSGVMQVLAVSSPGFREIGVRLDRNVQITGAPFNLGDQVRMTGRWDGQNCVATSLVKP